MNSRNTMYGMFLVFYFMVQPLFYIQKFILNSLILKL